MRDRAENRQRGAFIIHSALTPEAELVGSDSGVCAHTVTLGLTLETQRDSNTGKEIRRVQDSISDRLQESTSEEPDKRNTINETKDDTSCHFLADVSHQTPDDSGCNCEIITI